MSRRVINARIHEAEQKAKEVRAKRITRKNARKKAVKNEQHTSAAKSTNTRRSS